MDRQMEERKREGREGGRKEGREGKKKACVTDGISETTLLKSCIF
jgi:hypothetical protein